MQSSNFVNHSHDYRPNWTPLSPSIIGNNRLITEHLVQHSRYKCFIGFCFMYFLKDFPCHVVQKGEAKMDCDKDCDALKASQEKLTSKEDEIRKEKERKAQQVINSSLLRLILPPILYFYSCACQKKILVLRWLVSRASKSCRRLRKFYAVFSQAIRDLKIRRRRRLLERHKSKRFN